MEGLTGSKAASHQESRGDGGSGGTIAPLSLPLSSLLLDHVKPLLSETLSYVSVRDVVHPLPLSFQENVNN